MSKYQIPRAQRRENVTNAGRFKGGVMMPVACHPVRESESGSIAQSITYELDPIAGRMITPVTAEVVSVFVPTEAIHALKYPEHDYPGVREVVREELLSGNPLFDLEAEGEITQRMKVEPRSIGGVKMVNEAARLAYLAANNFLRMRKYVNAAQVANTETAILPAIISQTVLDRLNGVLDPEDRVNGAVKLGGEAIVKGLGVRMTESGQGPQDVKSTEDATDSFPEAYNTGAGNDVIIIEANGDDGLPYVRVDLGDADTDVDLTDFYIAERMDKLTREMRRMVDNNPVYGEDMVARWAAGLSVDPGKIPFVLYEKRAIFGMSMQNAMDGPNLDTRQTNLMAQHSFTVPIPQTELGGVVVTMVAVKPDETLANQPHPILSQPWGVRNHVADELVIDPVPVTVRDLYADCDQVDEETVALYCGLNHLEFNYMNYGWNRHLDPNDVAERSALWQLEVPMSVTPETVLYPADLNHYPFADQTAEVCVYTAKSLAILNTPRVFGPTPVEELAAIETNDVFQDAE